MNEYNGLWIWRVFQLGVYLSFQLGVYLGNFPRGLENLFDLVFGPDLLFYLEGLACKVKLQKSRKPGMRASLITFASFTNR